MNIIKDVNVKKNEIVRIEREKAFVVSTSRVSLQFEHVEMKTIIRDDMIVASNIQRVMHRADFVSDRERDRDRDREREREQEKSRKRERERRDREREQVAMSKET